MSLNICNKKKIGFIHIVKTGGSKIENLFFDKPGNSGSNHDGIEKFENYYNYYLFSFVRNPYLRIISIYNYLIKGGNQSVTDKSLLSNNTTIDTFLLKYNDTNLPHLKSQYDYLKNNNNINFIGKFENFTEDIKYLCTKFNVKYNNNICRKIEYDNYIIKPSFISKVNELYKIDFETYNYDMINLEHEVTLMELKDILNKKELEYKNDNFLVLLTQYKRNNIELQLQQIKLQTLQPKYIIVFQNDNLVNINIKELKEKYNFLYVKSEYNTKFFGRFAYCFTFDVKYCIIMDDDILPGRYCFENYLYQCYANNGLIGGNGRYCFDNKNKLSLLKDTGNRKLILVDFIGHLWCFKKEWLYYMFSIKPYTYDTGEDMHLCFTCKILGNINSYLAKQIFLEDNCDISLNKLCTDGKGSFLITPNKLRHEIQSYFINNYNYKYITHN
jgi:hypothetical protein